MPEIPLYNGGMQRPLEAPPGPVLDRERRPRVDSSGTIQGIQRVKQGMAGLADASMQPLLPPDLGAGESRGVQALAAGIQNFGQALNEIGMRRLEAKNYADLAEAENAMDMEYAAFEKWRSQNLGNPDAWEPEWQRRLEGLGRTLTSNKAYSPFVQERLGVSLQKFGGGSSIRVATEATNATLRRGAMAAEAKFEIAKGNRDRPGMIQARAEHKQFTGEPDDVEALRIQEGLKEIDGRDREDDIMSAPRLVQDIIEGRVERPDWWKDVSPAEEAAALHKSRVVISQNQRAILEKVEDDVLSKRLTSVQDFESKLEEYDLGESLDASTRAEAHRMIMGEQLDMGLFNKHLTMAKAYDKNGPDAELYEASLRTMFMSHPKSYREQLDKALDEKVQSGKSDPSGLKLVRSLIDQRHENEQLTDDAGSPLQYKQDRFLVDALGDFNKTKAFGFSEKQTEELQGITGPARIQRFREMLKSRTKDGKKPEITDTDAYNAMTPFTQNLFQKAMHEGSFIDSPNYEKSALRAAKLKQDAEEWFKANPNASEDEAMIWLNQQSSRERRSTGVRTFRAPAVPQDSNQLPSGEGFASPDLINPLRTLISQ